MKIKINKKYLMYFVTVPILYMLVKLFFKHSPARAVYAFISSWWYGLYISDLLKLKIKDIFKISFICLSHGLIYYLLEYKEPTFEIELIIHIFLITLFFLSPYLLNCFINYLINRYFNHKEKLVITSTESKK